MHLPHSILYFSLFGQPGSWWLCTPDAADIVALGATEAKCRLQAFRSGQSFLSTLG